MVQAGEQQLVADMKEEHQEAMTQWQEETEKADAKSAVQVAQVCCLNLLVTATGFTMRVLAVNLVLQRVVKRQHVILQGKHSSADKSTSH